MSGNNKDKKYRGRFKLCADWRFYYIKPDFRPMTEDEKIVKAFAENREQGARMLMQAFQEPLYNYVRRMVVAHFDAEDVLQEVFINAIKGLDSFRGESSLNTWMYRIATNECLRFLKSSRRNGRASDTTTEGLEAKLVSSPYVDYEDALAVQFQQALIRLPAKQRAVFNLRYYDELSYEEMSRVTGDKVATLKVHYHWATKKIKEYIINNWHE
jgi:RNA polymerase sigma-70 factor, ECF subfamily